MSDLPGWKLAFIEADHADCTLSLWKVRQLAKQYPDMPAVYLIGLGYDEWYVNKWGGHQVSGGFDLMLGYEEDAPDAAHKRICVGSMSAPVPLQFLTKVT